MKTTNITAEAFRNGLRVREMYLYCYFEDACIRACICTDNKLHYFTKLRGRDEFECTQQSGIVQQVLLEPVEISESDYNKFY